MKNNFAKNKPKAKLKNGELLNKLGFSRRYNVQIDFLSPAFIAFNKPHFADFVIEASTDIMEGDKKVVVYHYSKILSIIATNKIFALEKV